MDSSYLEHLVHPKYKTALQFDEANSRLTDNLHHDSFAVKNNIPILVTQATEESLMETKIHADTGSQFRYREHYQNDAEHYDYFKEAEDPVEKEEINRLHQSILSKIPPNAQWVLDVGSGGGWLAKAIEKKGECIISMDISEKNPTKALQNTPSPKHYGLVADVFELPVKQDSIDCIVASEIIEHVSDPKRFIAALYVALKPGGKMIITTPYNETIRYSLCIHCNQPTPHNAHLHSFTEETIKKYIPEEIKQFDTMVFNSKLLVKLRLQYLMKFLPLSLWQLVDRIAIRLTRKKAYRLMLVIAK